MGSGEWGVLLGARVKMDTPLDGSDESELNSLD